MPDWTGGVVKVAATAALTGGALFAPAVHAHAQAPTPSVVSVRAGAVTPNATAIEYGLLVAQPDSATAVQ